MIALGVDGTESCRRRGLRGERMVGIIEEFLEMHQRLGGLAGEQGRMWLISAFERSFLHGGSVLWRR